MREDVALIKSASPQMGVARVLLGLSMIAAIPLPAVPPAPPPTPPPLSPKPVALRFSNVFIPGPAKRQAELAFVDVLLDTDIPLFVDPFAFKIEPGEWAVECNDLVVSFFQVLVDAIKSG